MATSPPLVIRSTVHCMFRYRPRVSGSAGRMALFPVRSNPRRRPWHDRRYRQKPSDVASFQTTLALV